MPKVYEYKCSGCQVVFEEKNLANIESWPCDETPGCKGTFKRLYSLGGIVLKGNGFYKTDNRS